MCSPILLLSALESSHIVPCFFWLVMIEKMLLDVLKDLMKAASASQESFAIEADYVTTYFLPYYAGLLMSCILTCAKRNQNIAFSFIMAIGAVLFLVQHKLNKEPNAGITLINFAGGYFEGIIPSYCILLSLYFFPIGTAKNKLPCIVFEVSPKEVFAVAGTIGYLAV